MEEFLQYISTLGYSIPNITLDGKIHRFEHGGKRDLGWYIGWQNHFIKGGGTYIVASVGDWRSGERFDFKPQQKFSREDNAIIKQQLEEASKRRDEDKQTKQLEAAAYSLRKWDAITTPLISSDYTSRKKITNSFGVRIDNQSVIHVPMYDVAGKLWNIQRIFPDGAKRFIAGSRVSGCFFTLGSLSDECEEILICEGWATGATLHDVSKKPVVVAFNAGNLKSVAVEIHKEYPMSRITVCGDNDRFQSEDIGNVGAKKATEAAEVCGGTVIIPQFSKDDHKGTDFNDLYVFEGETEVINQLCPPPVENEIERGFSPLGYCGHDYYFYSITQKDVVKINTFTNVQLFALAPESYWYANYPGKKETNWNQAKESLVIVSRAMGPFDPDICRGSGVWLDAGRVVVNAGNMLHVDGKVMSMSKIKSNHVYIRTAKSIPSLHPVAMDKYETTLLTTICEHIKWTSPKSGYFLAGWLALSRIAGALPVRPHVWLTGGAGSGKTTVMKRIIKPVMGGVHSYEEVSSTTTEAGIRQSTKSLSKPLVIDEFESSKNSRTQERITNIQEILRHSWSASDAKITKGSPSGRVESFTVNFAALVSSIRPTLLNDADRSRFSILELSQAKDGMDSTEHWDQLTEMMDKLDTDYGERLFARMVKMIPVVIDNFKVLRKALIKFKSTARYGDQVGMLMAAYWALREDVAIDMETAIALINELQIEEDKNPGGIPDEYECLQYLATKKVMSRDSMGVLKEYTIDWLIRDAKHQNALKEGGSKESLNTLMLYGIFVLDDRFFVPTQNTELGALFRQTHWTDWVSSLARLPGSDRKQFNSRRHGISARGVWVQINHLDNI
jgi:putative DNA primase/helicase